MQSKLIFLYWFKSNVEGNEEGISMQFMEYCLNSEGVDEQSCLRALKKISLELKDLSV